MSEATTGIKRRAPRKTQFDIAERERLRSALLGYSQKHGIGVPTLQVRIADATDRSPDLLPLKTLQRFLTGIGRTNDAFLIPCFQFAKSLPTQSETADIARELGSFFGLAGLQTNADQSGTSMVAAEQFAGRYAVTTRPPRPKKVRVFDIDDDGTLSLSYSHCEFESTGPGSQLKVREQVFNPAMVAATAPAGDAVVRHYFEGVVLVFDPLVFIVSRNVLTRLPKAYWLREFGNGLLMGCGMEASFLNDMDEPRPYSDPVDFAFERVPHEERS
ncbi:hypothetical protein Msil_1971 [Methylocella silvestris BL2]|uniref:Uncharacterized protein n=1 Tax=Methylocella silvestris (strain DSM 15510 / CIP 108128 / LMG 27833 / NCIMB 13906 / BL2) TaxID=395965 RepID=B8EPR0_METSB|nr:hypothetical protein [Methylocella silvestris]ACK50914.1 hypothetical protein Msil_1971 [Methylocella silvestris BL2]